jgi:isoquinoline 1-oxidoreductase alpha subunit
MSVVALVDELIIRFQEATRTRGGGCGRRRVPVEAIFSQQTPVFRSDTEPPMIKITVNGTEHRLDLDPNMPLLWAIREHVGLTGTKYGCGMAQCGSCTLLLNGAPVRSCSTPLAAAAGGAVTTIEGLDSEAARALQRAWAELDVVQCGFCQSGQIVSAAALLEKNPAPTEADINAAMSGNICRCATYSRIRAAIKRAAANLA